MERNESIKILSEYMKRFSKKDVIGTIGIINEKIGSMYQISNKDFFKFNMLLKDYHSSISQIDKSSRSIEEFVVGEAQWTESKLKNIYIERKKRFGELLEISHSISETFVLVQTLSDRISVPFNNLKQNVMTIQYLMASLRLSLACNPFQGDDVLYGLIENLESYIVDFRKSIDEISIKHETLTANILSIHKPDNMHYLASNMPVESYITSSSRELKEFSTTGYFQNDMFRSLENHIKSCFCDLDEVVTNLQYHDIIRQKIEHIKEVQNTVISQLESLDDKSEGEDSIEAKFRFLARMPEVINVQVAQLMYINKDYQESVEKITSMLLDVGCEMKAVTAIFNKMTEGANKVLDDILPELRGRQSQYIALVANTRTCIGDVLNDFSTMAEQYVSAKEWFSVIFEGERLLREHVEDIELKLNERPGKSNDDLIERMKSVRTALKCNASLMSSCLNTISGYLQNVDDYRQRLDSLENTTTEEDTMRTIQANIIKYSGMAKENGEKSFELSNMIAGTTQNAEYYNYFKKTVDEIIVIMNKMNDGSLLSAIKSEMPKECSELLEYIEGLYTMKSERDVYDNVLGNVSGSNPESDNENNDIEFF